MSEKQNTGRTVEIRRCPSLQELARLAARDIYSLICAIQSTGAGIHNDGIPRIVLTGGGAGIATLQELLALDHAAARSAEDFLITAIDWGRIKFFFGDERYLPARHPDRNDTQAQEALLNHLPIPPENIYLYTTAQESTIPGELNDAGIDEAAENYAQILSNHAPKGFDLHLLGMGPEGHINSLFPHTDELAEEELLVLPVRDCPKPPALRVSLTIPAVNSSQEVWLLISGEAKKEAAYHALQGVDGSQWPAAAVQGIHKTVLYVDAEADPTAITT